MAHYAYLNEENIVTQVITGIDESVTEGLPEGFANWEAWYSNHKGQTCKRTSYNTFHGVHKLGGTPFRKNYAGIGYSYDSTRDAFIPPQPYTSWVLNESTCDWGAPVDMPTDADENEYYVWNESTISWDLKTL